MPGLSIKSQAVRGIEKFACPFVSRYEKGERAPDNEFIEEFGRRFNLSGNWLLYNEAPIYKSTGAGKDIEGLFLELSVLLKNAGIAALHSKDTASDVVKASLEDLTDDSPENYILLLEYMKKDPAVRQDVFRFFHLISKDRSDNRQEP